MRVNVEKVLERDQKLSDLDDRAGLFIQFHSFYSVGNDIGSLEVKLVS